MGAENSFDKIIKKVDKSFACSSVSEKLIIIDLKREIIINKPPLWGNAAYFIVSNNNDTQNTYQAEIICRVDDFTKGSNAVGISIRYRASCNPGNEEILCKAFLHAGTPSVLLEKQFNKWVNNFVAMQYEDFFLNYYHASPKLTNYIKDCANKELGMKLELLISLENEDKLDTLSLDSFTFPVRTCDFDEQVEITVSVDLLIDDKNKISALVNPLEKDHAKTILKKCIHALMQKTTLQEFYEKFKKTKTYKDEIVINLNSLITSFGREVGHLSFESKIPFTVEEFLEYDENVECRVLEYPEPITVNNKLQLGLTDLAKYRTAKAPDIKNWIKGKLDRIVHELLFTQKYIDILFNFKQTEDEIKRKIQEETVNIGYNLRHIVTVPNLKPLKLKENFTINTDAHNNAFPTKVPNVNAVISIVITARINNLEYIKDLLNKQIDVERVMLESVTNEMARVLHDIEPERYYMRFEYSGRENEESVETVLRNAITKVLKDKYDAEVVGLVFKKHETDITKRLKDLQGKMCPFKISLKPLNDGEAITFKGNFQVDGVYESGWFKFQLRDCKIAEIKDFLEEVIRERMETLGFEILAYTKWEHLNHLKVQIEKQVKYLIVEQFGIAVEITNFYRERTDSEEKLFDTKKKAMLLEIANIDNKIKLHAITKEKEAQKQELILSSEVDAISKLATKRNEIIHLEGNEDELDALGQKITAITGDKPSASMLEIEKNINDIEKNTTKPLKGQKTALFLPLFETNEDKQKALEKENIKIDINAPDDVANGNNKKTN